MERDFRYLRDKYGDAGARDIFEKICIELFQKKFENAYAVQASPGDDGIDVLVGDLDGDIIVYRRAYYNKKGGLTNVHNDNQQHYAIL